jgi:hypothetical protein
MASSKPTLNPLTDKPANKTQITKPFMLAYIKSELASDADREWFKKIVSNPDNQKEYKDQLHGTVYTDIDIPKVRKEFIDRFFPNLNKKEGKKTFIDEILGL